MAYTPHYLAQFGGRNVDDSGEVWECGIRCDTGAVAVDEEAYLNDAAPRLMTWWKLATGFSANIAHLDYFKFNRISPNGHYTDETTTHVHNYTGDTAGVKAQNAPADMSICYSWKTAAARGRASKGRIYLPNYVGQVDGFKMANTAAHAVWARALTEAIIGNDTHEHEVIPAIFSNLGDGPHNFITGVRVGDIWDVQRRRRGQVSETYAVLDF